MKLLSIIAVLAMFGCTVKPYISNREELESEMRRIMQTLEHEKFKKQEEENTRENECGVVGKFFKMHSEYYQGDCWFVDNRGNRIVVKMVYWSR